MVSQITDPIFNIRVRKISGLGDQAMMLSILIFNFYKERAKQMKLPENQNVENVVADGIKSYETRDLKKFKTIFSPSERHVSWGTGKDERFVGLSHFLEQLKRDFAQSDAAELKIINLYSAVHEKTAWLAVEIEPTITIKGKVHVLEILRGTFILVKESGRWLIEHTHASWPFPQQDLGNSFPSG